jgi:protein phosphatase 1 regulatory subunit 11
MSSNTSGLRPPARANLRSVSPQASRGAPGSGVATPTTGSATHTMTSTPTPSRGTSTSPDPLVLRLRGAHTPSTHTQTTASDENTTQSLSRGIRWAEDVVDNEGLGRKSSKVCCIYHKPRPVGESSDEEDSSSSSDSDASGSESPDDGAARAVGGKRGRKSRRAHKHDHGDDCGQGHVGDKGKRRPSPNAYEKMPKYNKGPGKG